MSLENIPKPEISVDYKRQYIRLTIVGIVLVLLLAVGNAIYRSMNPKEKTKTEKQENKTVENIDIITDNDSEIGAYFEKNKLDKTENLIENKKIIETENNEYNSNQVYSSQSQIYEYENTYDYDRGEMLRAYYAKLIQEEEQARTSSIGFSKGNNQSSMGNVNYGNGNNQGNQNIYPQGDFSNQYAQQNMQSEKRDFLENAKQSKFYNSYQEEQPISKFEVMAGTFIPATLITGINSDLPSKSVAIVRENVYDTVTGNHLLIPKGTRIIGTYDSGISFGQDRLLIVWQRLIFPNGKYIGLDNMGGVDLSGYAGFTGKVNNHFIKLLQAVVLSSAMGAGSAIVTDNDDDDWRSEAGKGAGQVILDFGNKMGERILNRQPTIEIKQGYRFNITVHSDLILSPYGE